MAETPTEPRPAALTPAQIAARNRRSVALAFVIAALVVLFYLITVFKMGAGILNRAL